MGLPELVMLMQQPPPLLLPFPHQVASLHSHPHLLLDAVAPGTTFTLPKIQRVTLNSPSPSNPLTVLGFDLVSVPSCTATVQLQCRPLA